MKVKHSTHIAPGKYFGVVWEKLAKDYNINSAYLKKLITQEKKTPYFNGNNPTQAEVLILQDKLITYGYPLDRRAEFMIRPLH